MEGAPTDLAGPEHLRTCDMETCPSGLRNLSVGVSPSLSALGLQQLQEHFNYPSAENNHTPVTPVLGS